MTVFYNRHFLCHEADLQSGCCFDRLNGMDAAWNQENADFRQKSVSYQEEKHMVTAVVGANWGDEEKARSQICSRMRLTSSSVFRAEQMQDTPL